MTGEVAERKKEFRTTVDGTIVKRVYTASDLEEFPQDNSLPGEYPFGNPALEHILPEETALRSVAEAGLHLFPELRRELSESAVTGGDQGFEPGTDQSGEYRGSPASGNRGHHR